MLKCVGSISCNSHHKVVKEDTQAYMANIAGLCKKRNISLLLAESLSLPLRPTHPCKRTLVGWPIQDWDPSLHQVLGLYSPDSYTEWMYQYESLLQNIQPFPHFFFFCFFIVFFPLPFIPLTPSSTSTHHPSPTAVNTSLSMSTSSFCFSLNPSTPHPELSTCSLSMSLSLFCLLVQCVH